MALTRSERGYTSALASVIIWALVPVGTRFFVQRVDPYLFNVIRFAASGVAALPLCLLAKPWRWPASDQLLLLLCAVFAVPGYNIPVALGARTVPAGELGVLIATEPVIITALTLILYRRPIHWRLIAGSLLALLGVMLTSGMLSTSNSVNLWSTLGVLFGAFSWSSYTVLAVRLNRRYGAFGVTGATLVAGTLILLVITLPMVTTVPMPDHRTILMLAGMGLTSSLLGFLLWNYAGTWVPSERLGLFLYLLPVVSVLAGVQFLGEALTASILLGGVLTIAGVYVASRASRPVPVAAVD